MPRAVANTETYRYDLKTAPPDGFVELRKFTYGEMIHRRELSSSAKAESNEQGDTEVAFTVNLTIVQIYEFRTAIIDHNLEDENGVKLNFANQNDVLRLDSTVAGEIETFIDKLNQPPKEDGSRPLPSKSTEPSSMVSQ